VVARLATEMQRIIRTPAVQERLVAQGAEVRTMAPAEIGSFFESERKRWAAVVAQGGVKID
jgi:tripartite-type tricarboxylate transporter receptor subunit TctC